MTDSLRDQLLGLGFKQSAPEKKPAHAPSAKQGARQQDKSAVKRSGGPPRGGKPQAAARNPDASSDLARAYAARSAQEQREKAEAEKLAQEQARLKREARAKLAVLLEGKALNDAGAEIARHFEYGGKIKRIYVTSEQLKALNAGMLGVAQQNGRYLLVTAEVLAQAGEIFAPSVALKVDPDALVADDPYSDFQYQIPDDLVW